MVMANREGAGSATVRSGGYGRPRPEGRPPWFAAVRDLYQARSMKRVAAWEALTSRRPMRRQPFPFGPMRGAISATPRVRSI